MPAPERRSVFETLSPIDLSEKTEKKGDFTYLKWAWAVDILLRHYPEATWEVSKFTDKEVPYLVTEEGMYFVEVAVTVGGITRKHMHPVLDNKNKPILKPNSFQINTSIMRTLVKTMGMHGLGLYLYAGEDVPMGVAAERETAVQRARELVDSLADKGWSREEISESIRGAGLNPGDLRAPTAEHFAALEAMLRSNPND